MARNLPGHCNLLCQQQYRGSTAAAARDGAEQQQHHHLCWRGSAAVAAAAGAGADPRAAPAGDPFRPFASFPRPLCSAIIHPASSTARTTARSTARTTARTTSAVWALWWIRQWSPPRLLQPAVGGVEAAAPRAGGRGARAAGAVPHLRRRGLARHGHRDAARRGRGAAGGAALQPDHGRGGGAARPPPRPPPPHPPHRLLPPVLALLVQPLLPPPGAGGLGVGPPQGPVGSTMRTKYMEKSVNY